MCATPQTPTAADHDPRIARSRSRLLAAATELLIAEGPRGVTADAIAEHSGVAKSTLYRHWGSINDLLVDVMRSNVPSEKPVDLSHGFEAALREWVDQAVVALSQPGWVRILPALLELRRHTPEMSAVFDADFAEKLAHIAAILELGAREGVLPVGLEPSLVTSTIVGPLVLTILKDPHAPLAPVADYVLERFLGSYQRPT